MSTPKLRAWWFHRQGLDGGLRNATPAQVLERAGWARSVGGVGPYLTLFARARTTREAADEAAAKLQIHELPSARGCTYVLPARDFALGLKVGEDAAAAPMKVATKLGVTEKEIEKLEKAVLDALEGGDAMDPDAIRDATGKASRNLGEEGKKKGVTTTLPLALGRLQAKGEIRRVPVNGRLDQQRYRYARWTRSPLAGYDKSLGEAYTELARLYFGWVGPATLAEFQWFSSLGAKAAKDVVAPLRLEAVAAADDRLMLPEDVDAWDAFEVPGDPCYALVSSLDSIAAARRNLASLVDAKDHARPVLADTTEKPVGGLSDLPSHAIFDRGRLIGLWEYDPEASRIAWGTFGVKKTKQLGAAVEEMETFVRDELGDARSFSLDSPKSRTKRIEALRVTLSS
jgi:hypothetical protein